jgi:phage antirepressor YoqD-like protein
MSSFEKNQIALAVNAKTMSSREIAELTGKEHKNVKRDCEIMFTELELDTLSFERIYLDGMNRQQTEYLLTYELVQTLITGYNIKLRHAVIQRLNELETKASQPKELSKLEILQMALESEQKVLALETKVSELAPKAAALDTIANATGQKTITNVAKVLGVQPEKFLRPWMIKHHWIHIGRDGQYHAHAARIKDGHLVEKSRAIPRTNGIADVKVTVYVTSLGETLLARRFAGEAA